MYLYGLCVSGEYLTGLERSFPREGTWVNFCWLCAAGLSEPLPHHSISCGHIIDKTRQDKTMLYLESDTVLCTSTLSK